MSEGHHWPSLLSCRFQAKRGSGYQTLADNLLSFSQIGCLRKDLDVSHLDDGDGIQSPFQKHKVKWHDSWRLQYNTTELIRAQKRKTSTRQTEGVSRKYIRQSGDVDHTHRVPETCFFYYKPAGKPSLRKASTFDLDKHVRKSAFKLQDNHFLLNWVQEIL